MKRIKVFILKLLRWVLPLTLIAQVILVIYGFVAPWSMADRLLSPYKEQTAVLVGVSSAASHDGSSYQRSWSRSYVFLPAALSSPEVVIFLQRNDEPIETVRSSSALFWLIASTLASVVATWWLWFRWSPPNNSFKPTPLRGAA